MNLVIKSIFMIFTIGVFILGVSENQLNVSYAKMEKAPNTRVTLITLERVFVDGEISEETLYQQGLTQQQICHKYKGWLMKSRGKGKIVFQKKMDDISPLLKANGYFGITNDGTVTIFNGKPDHEDIIHSFFQIDIKKLEGKKQNELLKGIPVKSVEDFNSVLKALKPYSMPKQKN